MIKLQNRLFYSSVTSPFAVKLFLLSFTSHCSTKNIGFNDSGYVIKPPQPSSAFYRQSKTWCYTTVKKVYFEVLSFLVIRVSQRFGDKKIGFNNCECIKFLTSQTSMYSMFGENAY